jgi:CRP-like cAMP-binding protein
VPVGRSSLFKRIERVLPLAPDERLAIAELEERELDFSRKSHLCLEDDPAGLFYILKRGLVMGSMNLASGRRQITRIHFPGDVLGLPNVCMTKTVSTLTALSDVTVSWFDKAMLARLFVDHPRIAAFLFVIAQEERVKLIDRVVSLGQTSAKSRIAAVLIQIYQRLRPYDPTIGTTIPLPLNQADLGDMTGLTSVHVNRTLRAMNADGLIRSQRGRVKILDEAGLAACSELPRRTSSQDFSWLPPPAAAIHQGMRPVPLHSVRHSSNPGGQEPTPDMQGRVRNC